jgi:hypothetical protein
MIKLSLEKYLGEAEGLPAASTSCSGSSSVLSSSSSEQSPALVPLSPQLELFFVPETT